MTTVSQCIPGRMGRTASSCGDCVYADENGIVNFTTTSLRQDIDRMMIRARGDDEHPRDIDVSVLLRVLVHTIEFEKEIESNVEKYRKNVVRKLLMLFMYSQHLHCLMMINHWMMRKLN